jgi:hypothetical protein
MSPVNQYVAEAREAELARRPLERPRTIGDRPMQRRLRFHRLLVTVVAVGGHVAGVDLHADGVADEERLVAVGNLDPGGDGGRGWSGVGHRRQRPGGRGGGYAWGLVAPRATLYDDNGKPIVSHFGGPTWQATDGSTVVGQRVDGVTVDATAIPWLLLSATSTSAGPDGARLVETTFIQRIATTGGLNPPAADCNAETAGTVVEVPYTADYYFWKLKR